MKTAVTDWHSAEWAPTGAVAMRIAIGFTRSWTQRSLTTHSAKRKGDMTPAQRTVWERRIGNIPVAWTEKHVEETIEELAEANPLEFTCPVCECKWKFHSQEQLDMIQLHISKHAGVDR